MLLATLRWNHPGWKTRERKKRKMEVEEEEEEGEEPLTAFPKAPLASANSDDSAPWFAIIIAN